MRSALGPLAVAAEVAVLPVAGIFLGKPAQIPVGPWTCLLLPVAAAEVLVAPVAWVLLGKPAQVPVGPWTRLLLPVAAAEVLVALPSRVTLAEIVQAPVGARSRLLLPAAAAQVAMTGALLPLLALFGAEGCMVAGAWPLLHALLAQGVVGDAPPVLVGIAAAAEALMPAGAACHAAVGPLAHGPVTCVALCLHALAAEVFVGAGEVALPVIVEVLLFVAEPIGSLLAIAAALRSVNTRLLTGGGVDPLRR